VERDGALPGAATGPTSTPMPPTRCVSRDQLAKAPARPSLVLAAPPTKAFCPGMAMAPSPGHRRPHDHRGVDLMRAIDIYTGRLLWEMKLPGSARFTTPRPPAGPTRRQQLRLDPR